MSTVSNINSIQRKSVGYLNEFFLQFWLVTKKEREDRGRGVVLYEGRGVQMRVRFRWV